MREKKRDVTDVIDIEYLQLVQDSIGRIMGITTALLNPDGIPVSRPTNLYAFCAMMQASETGFPMCVKTNERMIKINRETGRPAVITCPNSGLRTAAVPIFLEEEYLGSWLVGQIRMQDVDTTLIKDTARKAGLSEAEAMKNIAMLPVISEAEFTNILNFLETSTKTVLDLLEANTKLNNSVRTFQDFLDMTDIGAYLTDFYTDEVIMNNDHFSDILAESEAFWKEHPIIDKYTLLDDHGNPFGVRQAEFFSAQDQRWFNLRSRAIRWIDGRIALMTTVVDITERKREEQRIEYLAYHDHKLGIPNGVKLQEDLRWLAGEQTYIVCFDTKDLREINNVYGRGIGDRLLAAITAWIDEQPNHRGQTYRIKGNSFVVLMKECPAEQAEAFARRLFGRFDQAWDIDMDGIAQKVYSGTHIGIMQVKEVPDSYETFLNLIERVTATAARAEQPIFFDEKKNLEFSQDVQLRVSLKACVLNAMAGFTLNYQPVVDAGTGKWVAMEALCRWQSPELGNIRPDIFIAEAERLGLISAVSGWVFEEAISQVKAWGLDVIAEFHHLSVNLSPIQLRDRELPAKVLGLLEKYAFPADKLVLEVTETAEVKFDQQTLALLRQLNEAGVSLALDDFGIGYASFANLNNLPINMLKTDRSFLSGIEANDIQQKTMRFMIEYAHAAGMSVTVEGVETEQQREIIRDSGANLIQGFYFSRPLTGEILSELIDKFR